MKYKILNSIDEHIISLQITLDKKDDIQNVMEEKYNQILTSKDPKYQIKGFPLGKLTIDIAKKHFGDSIVQEAMSQILFDAMSEIVLEHKLRPCTLLYINTLGPTPKSTSIDYLCGLIKVEDYKKTVSQIHVSKHNVHITDECIDFYSLVQRIRHSNDFVFLDNNTTIERFDFINLLLLDTNIAKFINKPQLSSIIGSEDLFFELEETLIGKQVGELYTINTSIGFLKLIITDAKRLKDIISLEQLSSLEGINDIKTSYKEALKQETLRATHVFNSMSLTTQLKQIYDLKLPKVQFYNYMSQYVQLTSASNYDASFKDLVMHYVLYVLVPSSEEQFYEEIKKIDNRNLKMLGYINTENPTKTELDAQRVLYQSLQYISQHIQFDLIEATWREFQRDLVKLALTTYN